MVLAQPAEGEVRVNDLHLHYFEWKRRGARPLVLNARTCAYVFEDIGHSLLGLDPEQFARVVRDFLRDELVSQLASARVDLTVCL